MDTNKLGVVECLYKDEVACVDDYVLACLDNNDKDYFYVDFLHAHPLE